MKAKLAVLLWFLDCFLARVSVGQGSVLKFVFVGQRKSGDWGDPVIPRRGENAMGPSYRVWLWHPLMLERSLSFNGYEALVRFQTLCFPTGSGFGLRACLAVVVMCNVLIVRGARVTRVVAEASE